MSKALEPVFEADDFGWEWPIGAVVGWRSHAIQRLGEDGQSDMAGRSLLGADSWMPILGFPGWAFPFEEGMDDPDDFQRALSCGFNKRCPGRP